METLETPVLLLTLAMFLALGTERLLELVRAVADHLEARHGSVAKWNRRASQLRDRIEARLDNARTDSAAWTQQSDKARANAASPMQMALYIVCRYLSPASADTGGLIAIYAQEVRRMSIRVRYKVFAAVFGVAFAFAFDIDVFALVAQESGDGAPLIAPPEALAKAISGLIMGLGAGPVHSVITALERARELRK